MYHDKIQFDTFFIGVIVGALITTVLVLIFTNPYKNGQIDAINGKIKYELIEKKNGEKVWQKKEQEE